MRNRRRTFKLLAMAATIAIAWPSAAAAWGPDGHDYIASVARDLLHQRDPALEARFQALLAGNILRFQGTDTKTGRATICNGRNLREIASWPDCIRRTREQVRTGGFHFDDVRLCDEVPPPPPPASYCAGGLCASEGLRHFISILRDHHRSRHDRAVALAWVIHIVGDLHQPLHNEDNHDSGGNFVATGIVAHTFTRNFSAANLHSVWDTPMVFAAVGEGNAAVAAVRAAADAHAGDPAWAGPAVDGTPASAVLVHNWVVGAHAIAQRAYAGLSPAPACDAGRTTAGRVGIAYFTPFNGDVRDQLARAAVRLTDILEQALA